MKVTQIKWTLAVMLVVLTGSGYAVCYKNQDVSCTSECDSACSEAWGHKTPTWSNGVKFAASTSGTGQGRTGTQIVRDTCTCEGEWITNGTVEPTGQIGCNVDLDRENPNTDTCNL